MFFAAAGGGCLRKKVKLLLQGVSMCALCVQGKSQAEIANFSKLFAEIQQQIDTKQLRPMIRTQYLRTAFQIPFDSTVRISLDTNLTMIKENPDDGPTCTVAGRWVMSTHACQFALAPQLSCGGSLCT